jgi:hypothetical protein
MKLWGGVVSGETKDCMYIRGGLRGWGEDGV